MTIKDNKPEPIESPLGEKEMLAIEMRFEGYTYKEIGAKIEIHAGAIAKWFMNGGKLYEFYQSYAKEEADIRRKASHDMFKAHLGNAVRTLVQVMQTSKIDIARIAAAKEVINRQLGEPVKVIATDGDKVNEYLEAINKFKDGKEALSGDVSRREDSNPS